MDDVVIPKIDPNKNKADASVLVPENQAEVLNQVKPNSQTNTTVPESGEISKKPFSKNKTIWLSVGALFLVFIFYNLVAIYLVYQNALKVVDSGKKLQTYVQEKDLVKIKTGLDSTKKEVLGLRSKVGLLSWAKILPVVGGFVSDAGHGLNAAVAGIDAGDVVISAAAPYSDLLGLGGTEPKTSEQSTQERIDFVLKTIPDLIPKIDEISGKVSTVNEELSKIDAERYPEKYKGQVVRSKIKTVQSIASEVSMFLTNGKPVLESAPYLLGMESPRNYLILFQNDKELRPTGGFLTAYAIMKVDKAKFEPVSSNDIYNLDALYKPSIPAPDPIVKYIKGPYILSKNLRLRDMNWSPDFPQSMDMFSAAAKEAGVKGVDGIIAVDTHLLENILDVIGPIGVPGFGNFSTEIDPECNCSQVIHELESFADVEGPIVWDPVSGKIVYKPKNADNRKKIIGPLMNSILANALGQPKEKLPDLVAAVFTSLIEKHVLFYIDEANVQKAMSDFGLAGKVKDYDGDYLHINDANLGGRKSNLYATEEVEQVVNVAKDGGVTKTVTITYKNPEKHDGWLNSVLPTWVRVYVPKGSELIAAEGLETTQDPYEDLGKTVYAGFFQLRPEGVSKITFKYKLPFKVTETYKMLIQKQPGTDGFLYTVKVGKKQDEFFLKTDKEIKIDL